MEAILSDLYRAMEAPLRIVTTSFNLKHEKFFKPLMIQTSYFTGCRTHPSKLTHENDSNSKIIIGNF